MLYLVKIILYLSKDFIIYCFQCFKSRQYSDAWHHLMVYSFKSSKQETGRNKTIFMQINFLWLYPVEIILILSFKIKLRINLSECLYLILIYPFPPPLIQYSDDDETNCLTQGDKLRALKSKRQAKAPTASPLA